jgi:hypothetical protein
MLERIAILTIAMMLFGATSAYADATIPNKDIANARDNALLKRYDGSFIVSHERLAFTDFKVPLAANFRIDPRRLRAAGVGMMAPAASNDADDGRAKNRRVEVVKLN